MRFELVQAASQIVSLCKLTKSPNKERQSERRDQPGTVELLRKLVVSHRIHRGRTRPTRHQTPIQEKGLANSPSTYTHKEPSEQIITINHRLGLLKFRGQLGSFSSQSTVKSSAIASTVSSSSGDFSLARSSPVLQLYPSFKDQLRSRGRDDAEWSLCMRSSWVACEVLMGSKAASRSPPLGILIRVLSSVSLFESLVDWLSADMGMCAGVGKACPGRDSAGGAADMAD